MANAQLVELVNQKREYVQKGVPNKTKERDGYVYFVAQLPGMVSVARYPIPEEGKVFPGVERWDFTGDFTTIIRSGSIDPLLRIADQEREKQAKNSRAGLSKVYDEMNEIWGRPSGVFDGMSESYSTH